MFISATSDIHAPLHLQSFLTSVKQHSTPVAFLLAGDICEVSMLQYYKIIYESLPKCQIFACFGNTESRNREMETDYETIKKLVPNIKFLQEEKINFHANGKTMCIAGSKGVIDLPVKWQRDKIPGIFKIQKTRMEKLKSIIETMDGDINILFTHHPPTFATMGNEKAGLYSALGSRKMEKIIKDSRLDFVIHGHLHSGAQKGFIGTVPVFNVAFPANREIVKIEIT